MTTNKEQKPEWKVIVDLLRETNPALLNRLGRKMMNYLFKRNVKKVEQLLQRLNVTQADYQTATGSFDNQPMPRLNSSLLEELIDETFIIAEQELTAQDIARMMSLWMKQEQFRFLSMAAEKRDVSLTEISEALHRYCLKPGAQKHLSREERIGIRVALIRRFFSEDLEYINTLKHYVSVNDFAHLMTRVIGPARGNGKMGGKAAGLFRAAKILMAAKAHNIGLRNLSIPKTWYITSDGILEFLHYNALEEMPTIKYRDPAEIRQEYAYVGQIFKNSSMPPEILAGLNVALEDFGDTPLIVRSSSLLEDTKGSAFAGKYKSLFVANQGSKKERLDALIDAIVEVYASTFGPDPIEYRRERRLLDFNEEMGIMIQQVVGRKVGHYWFPAFAGVAFSSNEFRWSPRIRREDGIVRLVAGLGTRAVDRMGEDFPMLISPGQPGLRVNITPDAMLRYAQKNIDVLNLETSRFETINFEQIIHEYGSEVPMLPYLVSMYEDGQLYPPIGTLTNLKSGTPVLTFANLLQNTPFLQEIKDILRILKDALGWPVDIEFAAGEDQHTLYLLQCRPQCQADGTISIAVPKDVAHEDRLFTASKHVTSAALHGIEYVVYVDPANYDSLPTLDEMLDVGHLVSELNQKLPERKFILMGPGRWGSRGDIKLGVKVGYSDINNAAMMVEIARRKLDYTPDLSFGTHFFQDLVEANIKYLPLYPDEAGNVFNEAFFQNSPNCLRRFVSKNVSHAIDSVVRVIHIPGVADGATMSIVMDGDQDKALGYFNRENTAQG
ncbi:MAG TPA: PEP/pyruvate-binding domain-containing protein [Candidatus Ozemobacteraceae bacterium]|nr:PEP/pyruvate-binding domain-containing protein [Candidatus Ozemobacteraceae bacterium]